MLQGQIAGFEATQRAQRDSREAYQGIASDDWHEGGSGQGEERRVLEDMQREMVWLRDHEQSAWAMGLTDVLPPGHARYMTP